MCCTQQVPGPFQGLNNGSHSLIIVIIFQLYTHQTLVDSADEQRRPLWESLNCPRPQTGTWHQLEQPSCQALLLGRSDLNLLHPL